MAFWNKKNKNEKKEIVKTSENTGEFENSKAALVNDQSTSTTNFKSSSEKLNNKVDKAVGNKTIKRNIYYVSARKDKSGRKIGWEVKRENAAKVTRIVGTKEEALEIVKELAGNNESTVIIRKVDGSIQETIKFKSK